MSIHRLLLSSYERRRMGADMPRVRISVVPLGIIGTILVLHTPMQAQGEDAHVQVSLERIRAALEGQPSRLQLPAPSGDVPTFRMKIRESLPILQSPEEKPFDPTFGLPSVGELIMGGVEKVRSAVVNYKRRRAERRARKEVEDALAGFCATNGCSTSNPRQ
jgi:hypothetical protein